MNIEKKQHSRKCWPRYKRHQFLKREIFVVYVHALETNIVEQRKTCHKVGTKFIAQTQKQITTTTESKALTLMTTFKWKEDSHVIIEIGLHKSVMPPQGNDHHVIGIEASLE